MQYINYIDINGVRGDIPVNQVGNGAPTTSTVGAVGQFYMDKSTEDYTLYKCVNAQNGIYTWVSLGKVVQPDWAQNDEKAADYVKNRTHYEEVKSEATVLLPSTAFTADENEDGLFAHFSAISGVEIGNEYIVGWNGVDYTCTAQALPDDSGLSGAMFGNGSIWGLEDNGEPFVLIVVSPDAVESVGGVGAMALAIDGSTSVNVSITSTGTKVVHKLDNKFLDLQWLPTAKASDYYIKDVVIAAGGTYSDTTSGLAAEIYNCAGKCTLLVYVDGVPMQAPITGTLLDGFGGGVTSILFHANINTVAIMNTDSVEHTVSVYLYEYNTIPRDFIPMSRYLPNLNRIGEFSNNYFKKCVLVVEESVGGNATRVMPYSIRSDYSPSYSSGDDVVSSQYVSSAISYRLSQLEESNSPITLIENTDSSNKTPLRSLASGTYVLKGYFTSYEGGSESYTFSTGMLVAVVYTSSISYVQIFYPKNNTIQYLEITDDSVTRKDAKLVDMESVANMVTTVDSSSDDSHYPSAKAVYTAISDSPKIFVAEYGVTTFEELIEASNAGKTCMCEYNGALYPCVEKHDDRFVFAVITSSGRLNIVYVYEDENRGWVFGYTDVQLKYYVTSTISADSTDEQYPTAKAVYEAISSAGVGYTLTDTDKSDIANLVLDALPTWEGGSC